MTPLPALVLLVALRTADGAVAGRQRWCWAQMPTAAAFLDEVARRRVGAARLGLVLSVEQAPPDAAALLGIAGLPVAGPRGHVTR